MADRMVSLCQKRVPCLGSTRSIVFRYKGALSISERPISLISRQRSDLLEIVPWIFRFLGRLHLEQMHVADHAAVFADIAVGTGRIVDLQLLHLLHDGLRVHRASGLDRLQVMIEALV